MGQDTGAHATSHTHTGQHSPGRVSNRPSGHGVPPHSKPSQLDPVVFDAVALAVQALVAEVTLVTRPEVATLLAPP